MTYIGIDPGTNTGLAVWDSGRRMLTLCETMKIHQALREVDIQFSINPGNVIVIFEDARQRKWYSGDSNAKIQGAGSIKRDCTIWEDFCKDRGIPFQAVPPGKGMTKVTPEYLRMVTGWTGRTSNHARDAAMLVIGR